MVYGLNTDLEIYEDVDVPVREGNAYINMEDGTGAFVCRTNNSDPRPDSNNMTRSQNNNGYTSLTHGTTSTSRIIQPIAPTHQSLAKFQMVFTVTLALSLLTLTLVVVVGLNRLSEYA